MLITRFFDMRPNATTSPSGRENSSVKKKIISVLPKPSFMESTSFINASKLLKYLMKASGNVNLERNNRMRGCLTKKRQLLFWYKKKHSDYENPNACGRM